ncbi:MAG: 4-hydroxy-tetrahydrodipicolinate reductase [Candidatus Eisenbacteria bacterium]|uniref:4-hydroxy-tetrahydrodipicolinate reductase n=1 Tax=Eiseniibacteriota bacterium TaxID=2212470 RepID=A0A956SD60_UNCEI|nr:4-hydroxy-tetrahydrodipicolinate reductase [Candidatus Eisenbacteria bacterium]
MNPLRPSRPVPGPGPAMGSTAGAPFRSSGTAESEPLRLLVVGSNGRMGRKLCTTIEAAKDLELAGSVDSDPDSWNAIDPRKVDAVVEFTHASAIVGLASRLEALGKPWLSGTTGLDEQERHAIEHTAARVPVLWAANTSLGVALLRHWLREAAELLPPDWELEIVETHHTGKKDAPSGTALALAEVYREVRGGKLMLGRGRESDPREAGEIGIQSLRLPGVVGEHRVHLSNGAESFELTHRAHDRVAFVLGALEAVRWLVGRPAGLYGLDDWAQDRLGN